jgi:hypothetical protein
MKPKSASAEWYIAATHWLTAGFVVPFIAELIVLFTVPFLTMADLIPLKDLPVLAVILGVVFRPLVLWRAVIDSARYVNRKYEIKNANKVIMLATIYLFVFSGISPLIYLIGTRDLMPAHFGLLIGYFVFYFVSKKYIKNTQVMETPAPIV